jgi:hypothetical protein
LSRAPMAELVDASDSKSDSARSAGSIPARGTTDFFDLESIIVFPELVYLFGTSVHG